MQATMGRALTSSWLLGDMPGYSGKVFTALVLGFGKCSFCCAPNI